MRRAGILMAGCLWAALALAGCASSGGVKVRAAAPPPPTPAASDYTPLSATAIDAPLGATPTAAALTRSAEVRRGDSLWRISRRTLGAGSRFSELARLNKVEAPWVLQPGQTLALPGSTAVVPPQPARPGRPPAVRAAKKANHAFGVGEKLVFAVQYFNVTAGYATLSIPEYTTQLGRPCLHIVAEAKTHPFFESFFKVKDRIESHVDMEYLVPWRYEKHLREGGYSADTFFTYDQRQGLIINDRGRGVSIPAEAQDVISCFYLYRTLDVAPGSETFIKVTADDMKSYELQVKCLRREKVGTLAGDFDCLVVQPFLKFEGVFQQKGEVLMWISDDERRLPVKIQSKIVIGSININLQSAEWVKPE